MKDRVTAVGQDISKVAEETFPSLVKYPDQPPDFAAPDVPFFEYADCNPSRGPDGRIAKLTVADNV